MTGKRFKIVWFKKSLKWEFPEEGGPHLGNYLHARRDVKVLVKTLLKSELRTKHFKTIETLPISDQFSLSIPAESISMFSGRTEREYLPEPKTISN